MRISSVGFRCANRFIYRQQQLNNLNNATKRKALFFMHFAINEFFSFPKGQPYTRCPIYISSFDQADSEGNASDKLKQIKFVMNLNISSVGLLRTERKYSEISFHR